MPPWGRSRKKKPPRQDSSLAPAPAPDPQAPKTGLFGRMTSSLGRVKEGLAKTRSSLTAGLKAVFSVRGRIDQETLDTLEELLITADMGVETVQKLLDRVRQAWKSREIETTDQLQDYLKAQLKALLRQDEVALRHADQPPTVILVAGVNGSGKTTSIAKLAHHFTDQGGTVLLAASDTFRAAAVEQLSIWAQRLGVGIVRHQRGADPGAVAYDACEAAVAREADILIVDTAGRLHTERNLMRELEKIRRVLGKKIPGAPHEVLLVLDATTGQNAIAQARQFQQAIDVTGIFLAKLDGTAKGGIVVAVRDRLGIPVKFVGIGERPTDIQPFEPQTFVEALFA
ncbi:MAG: signal recognition particle-docking protein FtsY [Candidatus Brocadiia bacterium]